MFLFTERLNRAVKEFYGLLRRQERNFQDFLPAAFKFKKLIFFSASLHFKY